MEESNKTTPMITFRDNPLSAAVWKVSRKIDLKMVYFYNVTFQSSYKDSLGEFHTTNSIAEKDILKGALLLQKAYNWIANAKQKDLEKSNESNDSDNVEVSESNISGS